MSVCTICRQEPEKTEAFMPATSAMSRAADNAHLECLKACVSPVKDWKAEVTSTPVNHPQTILKHILSSKAGYEHVLECTKWFLDNTPASLKPKGCQWPVFEMAHWYKLTGLRVLLDLGEDVDTGIYGYGSLLQCVLGKHLVDNYDPERRMIPEEAIACAKLLIERGATIQTSYDDPLGVAVRARHIELVCMMLDHGARNNVRVILKKALKEYDESEEKQFAELQAAVDAHVKAKTKSKVKKAKTKD